VLPGTRVADKTAVVPLLSFFKRSKPDVAAPRFGLRWWGYDRSQVDEFLRQTALDRQQLEEGLAQLEALVRGQAEERRREAERLTRLRIEVASCLEANIGALRTATGVLSNIQMTTGSWQLSQAAPAKPVAPKPLATLARLGGGWSMPDWISRRSVHVAAASALLLVSVPAGLLYRASAGELPARKVAPGRGTERSALHQVQQPVTQAAASTVAAAAAGPVAAPAPAPATAAAPSSLIPPELEGLVLTLTAGRQCWVRTNIDGGQPLERLLKSGETIMVRATQEVVLRVGDAAALSLLINNKTAKPLGSAGQVVTTRITRANYGNLLTQQS
jgi:uncharacterized protein DUF4115